MEYTAASMEASAAFSRSAMPTRTPRGSASGHGENRTSIGVSLVGTSKVGLEDGTEVGAGVFAAVTGAVIVGVAVVGAAIEEGAALSAGEGVCELGGANSPPVPFVASHCLLRPTTAASL